MLRPRPVPSLLLAASLAAACAAPADDAAVDAVTSRQPTLPVAASEKLGLPLACDPGGGGLGDASD